MFPQFGMVMYRNLSFQDTPCLLYDVTVSVLNDLRKMFNANYHYLLVTVSGNGARVLTDTPQHSCLLPNAITSMVHR